MDTRLIGVLTRVAGKFSARRIDVVSGYRSPKYNLMLRKKGRQVARDSQHTHGNAVDFRIKGVTTRQVLHYVRSLRVGGVGFYPHSQFVHSDTGRVRYWTGLAQSPSRRPAGADQRPLPDWRVGERSRASVRRSAISWFSEPEAKPARSSATKVKPCARPSVDDRLAHAGLERARHVGEVDLQAGDVAVVADAQLAEAERAQAVLEARRPGAGARG